MRRTLIASLVVALATMFVPAIGTGFAATTPKPDRDSGSDIVRTPPDVRAKIRRSGAAAVSQEARIMSLAQKGEIRTWLGLDDVAGAFYTKNYRLRGVGEHIEVWTTAGSRKFNGVRSTGLQFQKNDCRNGVRTKITSAQIRYFIDQFDNTIYPIESELFSVPPDRDGSEAPATEALGLPADYYTGDGDDIVVLIDNVRDDNFYDRNNTKEFSYIAGFFSSGLNGFFNRNVMTIDGFDWLHRTGLNPPNDPVPGDTCASAPARPALYEGVFAHEYQHLLLSYVDPPEVTWVNEGLSDTAIALDRLRRPRRADHRPALRLAHPVLPRLQQRPDRREPEPQTRRSGELAERVGGPGLRPRAGDPLRLRGGVQLPAVAGRHLR